MAARSLFQPCLRQLLAQQQLLLPKANLSSLLAPETPCLQALAATLAWPAADLPFSRAGHQVLAPAPSRSSAAIIQGHGHAYGAQGLRAPIGLLAAPIGAGLNPPSSHYYAARLPGCYSRGYSSQQEISQEVR